MLDALIPAAADLARQTSDASALEAATQVAIAAEFGAESTRNMLASKGRSSYLGNRALGHIDPGAFAVTVWARAVASAFES
jgi:dihydroxyacetone kinase